MNNSVILANSLYAAQLLRYCCQYLPALSYSFCLSNAAGYCRVTFARHKYTRYTCHIVLAFNRMYITNRGTWGYWQQAYYVNALPSYLDVKNSLHVSVDLPANRTFPMIKHVSWLQISRSYTAFVGWTRANQTWKRCGLRRPMYTHTYQLLHMKVHNNTNFIC